jgi:hypothetical protein
VIEKNYMKSFIFILLITLPHFLASQEKTGGFIVLATRGETIEIPVSTVTLRKDTRTLIQAFGSIGQPVRSSILISFSIYPCIFGRAEIDTPNCFISYKHIYENGEEFYLSFGFDISSPSFVMTKERQWQSWESQKESAQLYISVDDHQNDCIMFSGCFASFHQIMNKIQSRGKSSTYIEGKFILMGVDPWVHQVNYFPPEEDFPSRAPFMSSTQDKIVLSVTSPVTRETTYFYEKDFCTSPLIQQNEPVVQFSPIMSGNNQSNTPSPQSNNYRATQTGRGPLQKSGRISSPVRFHETAKGSRTSSSANDEDSKIRESGFRRGGK